MKKKLVKKSEIEKPAKVWKHNKTNEYFITDGEDADWFFGGMGTRVFKKDLPAQFEITAWYDDYDV